MSNKSRQALPTSVRPTHYRLRLEPNFENKCFQGFVQIQLKIQEPTETIVLNTDHLNVKEAGIWTDDKFTPCSTTAFNDAEETVTFTFPKTLVKDEAVRLDVTYQGLLLDNSEGFHQTQYTDDNGKEHHVGATALEPTYARRLLPCFDEPAIRVPFVVSAIVDESFACFSNMPVSNIETRPESKKLFTFQETPPMPTYLLALMTGHLAQVRASSSPIPLSIICSHGREEETEFALDLATKGLQFFESLFQCPYPLPKLDLVAVPECAVSGMENWGLIMFKEINVLLDADSANDRKRVVAETVLHELAHMWFGDLVTMKYWEGLWLKESFAKFMAWVAMDKFFPTWNIWDRFVAGDLQTALGLDSLKSAHAVEQVVHGPKDIKQIYDEISYQKGCCLLRMVASEAGFDKFMEGVRLYIHRFEYKSTQSEDLWGSLEEVFRAPVMQKMETWTKKPGFPIVMVVEKIVDGNLVSVRLSQSRFDSAGAAPSAGDGVYPLRISIRLETGNVEVFDMPGQTATIPVNDKSKWIKVNANHDGFFVTSYTQKQLQKVIEAAVTGKLTIRDCVGLSCDLRRLVVAGSNSTRDLLDLVLGFRSMDSQLVWETLAEHLSTLEGAFKFQSTEVQEGLRKLAKDILGTKAMELGWDLAEDDVSMATFKADIFSAAGLAGHEYVVKAALGMFAQRMNGDEQAIPPSLRYEVFGIAAAYGTRKELQALLNIWKTSKNDDEKYLAIECTGRARNPEDVRWVLGQVFTAVGREDMFIMLWLVGKTATGAVELWEWTKRYWVQILAEVPTQLLPDTFKLLIQGLNTGEQISDVVDFFAAQDTTGVAAMYAQKLEEMETTRRWVERDVGVVVAWLESHEYME